MWPESFSKTTVNLINKKLSYRLQLWAVLAWAVLAKALGRFVLVLGRFGHRYGPFWTCQKLVGRFGLGRFGFGPFWSFPFWTTL